PHPREARRQTRLRLRSHSRHFRILARSRRTSHSASTTKIRPPPSSRHRQASPRNRSSQRSPHHPAHVSETHRENRRQARRKDPEFPDAAVAEAGPLLRRKSRTLRPGRDHLYAFHLAHPPLSGPDRAPHPERSAARREAHGDRSR